MAISDLIVGVSNDAVNFINSAVGSKAFSFKVIMFVAALGIILGSTFSSGMMEVARSGIFHPQYFYFSEIMFLFLAVMITDVILLDMFNTFGMPTSTTVSLVFELMGAAVGIVLVKILTQDDAMSMYQYINSEKTITIVFSILLSVGIAFTFGVLFQYLSRLLFTFNYQKTIKYFGAIWGSLAIVGITYFMMVKGAKGASFLTPEMVNTIENKALIILLFSFIGWAIIFQLLIWFTKFDIFKIVVLFGTFSLAMAFAGNDLVNFIGVPMAGWESYKMWMATNQDAGSFLMGGLADDVSTPTYFLLFSGIIMAITLYVNKKARSVTDTEVSLGRQEEGYEKFGSSTLSRKVVRGFTRAGKYLKKYIPQTLRTAINKRFDRQEFQNKQIALGKNAPAFDLVRAAVILAVSSTIISIGTTLVLPLSTTYVTFMVAMGASLADGAWGRETAVYRITGVFSVIGGWFLTGFFAFSGAFLLALAFSFGTLYAVGGMLIIAGYILFRTHSFHKKKSEAQKLLLEDEEDETVKILDIQGVKKRNFKNFSKFSQSYKEILSDSIKGLDKEDLDILSKNYKKYTKLFENFENKQNQIYKIITRIQDSDSELGNYYTINLYYIRELIQTLKHISWDTFHHVDNNHKPLMSDQSKELDIAAEKVIDLLNDCTYLMEKGIREDFEKKHLKTIEFFTELRKNQIKRIKEKEVGNRNSMLFFGIIAQMRSAINFTKRIYMIESNFQMQQKLK